MGDFEYAILSLMDERGISQAELSRRSGISKSSLSRYLAGDDMPSSRLKAIAAALGVTTDVLLGIEDMAAQGERELIEVYRSLDERDQKRLLAFARAMLEG